MKGRAKCMHPPTMQCSYLLVQNAGCAALSQQIESQDTNDLDRPTQTPPYGPLCRTDFKVISHDSGS